MPATSAGMTAEIDVSGFYFSTSSFFSRSRQRHRGHVLLEGRPRRDRGVPAIEIRHRRPFGTSWQKR